MRISISNVQIQACLGICKWNIETESLPEFANIEISYTMHWAAPTTHLWVTRAVRFSSRQFCTSKVQILLFHSWLAAPASEHRGWSRFHECFWKPEVRPWAVEREDMHFWVDACENAGDIIFQKGDWESLGITCGNKEKQVGLQRILKTILSLEFLKENGLRFHIF